jgi:hypothetical protein
MTRSTAQILSAMKELTAELKASIEAAKTPQVRILPNDGNAVIAFYAEDTNDQAATRFTFEDGILTIEDYSDDRVSLDLNEVLPAGQVTSETEFIYNGVKRRGFVIGLAQGRDDINVEVMETWNERDGENDEPVYKLFTVYNIDRPYREKS